MTPAAAMAARSNAAAFRGFGEPAFTVRTGGNILHPVIYDTDKSESEDQAGMQHVLSALKKDVAWRLNDVVVLTTEPRKAFRLDALLEADGGIVSYLALPTPLP